MPAPLLLADCGNSSCKLASSDRPAAMHVQYHRYDDAELPRELVRLSGICQRLVLLPGNAAGAALLRRHWPGPLSEVGRELPLPDCGQYEGCGADRVLAGMAAVDLVGGDCIVVSAGTASTIDRWHADQAAATGARFGGGCIAAGPDAMLAGLHLQAPALPRLAAAWEEPAFPATDTAACLQAGARLGARLLIAGMVGELRAGRPELPVVCTGGWCDAQLHRRLQPCTWRSGLVLTGLQRCAAAAGLQ